ncbi:hypothetical protein VE02_02230 [Pseudogymnoascus sp. 03VT05]|nr:hypothetical protein VE02_02230 [Pseudogymnoascus sp. 03VT05]
MPINRSGWRDIHIYDASTNESLGGLYQKGSITDQVLLHMIGSILLIVNSRWTVKHRESDRTVTPSDNVALAGPISVNNEPWFFRLISHAVSGREDSFRNDVRSRDRNCVISGLVNEAAQWNFWSGFEAEHVFPMEYESLWIEFNYSRWITSMENAPGSSKINSIQNGLLMSGNLHTQFDQYLFSINPDDAYRIITFFPNGMGIDGRTLDPACRDPNDPNHVSDEILRWHFRQSVLANMRGEGEPIFETDFPAGRDMETLREEPYGKERLEMELEWRLGKPSHEHVE